jgi:hypothetical protein
MTSSRFPATVDDVTVRLIAAVVLVVSVLTLATRQWWLLGLLAVDFGLRAGLGPRFSPVARMVQTVVRPRVKVPPQPTPGPPKRFAATIGFVFTVVGFVLSLVAAATGSSGTLAVVVGTTVVMVVFPLLESVFGLCVGCKVFSGLMALGVIPDEICLDCADISRRTRVGSVSS